MFSYALPGDVKMEELKKGFAHFVAKEKESLTKKDEAQLKG